MYNYVISFKHHHVLVIDSTPLLHIKHKKLQLLLLNFNYLKLMLVKLRKSK